MVVSIDGAVEAYDAGTGERVWWIDGLSGNRLPSPVLTGGRIVVASSDSRSNLALPVGNSGRLPEEQVLWRGRSATASMSSPVVNGEAIYFINSRGVIRCLELDSGRSRWATRLASAAWATPIVNGDRVYVFGTDGVASIFRRGRGRADRAGQKLAHRLRARVRHGRRRRRAARQDGPGTDPHRARRRNRALIRDLVRSPRRQVS